jgi:hypothetical protein
LEFKKPVVSQKILLTSRALRKFSLGDGTERRQKTEGREEKKEQIREEKTRKEEKSKTDRKKNKEKFFIYKSLATIA